LRETATGNQEQDGNDFHCFHFERLFDWAP
jgi:hypothetical protein